MSVLRSEDGETEKILAEIDKMTNEKEEADKKIDRLIEKKAEKDTEIQTVLGKIKLCEERVAKAGGGFYEKRESLKEEKSRLSTELKSIEREISQLCTNILPFCLVPDQLNEIKQKISKDRKNIQQGFEKEILEENFNAILKEMKSKNNDVKEITRIFNDRLENLEKDHQLLLIY